MRVLVWHTRWASQTSCGIRTIQNALVANGATPEGEAEQDGFWRAREVYAFVGDAEVMGKASHVPLGRWQGPRDDGQ